MPKITFTASITKRWLQVYKSVWLFPIVLTFILLLLTALKINGSSLGMYHNILYGQNQKDSNLIFGTPRMIRSDEWVVNTQLTIAQVNNNFAQINKNIGHGQDMSVVLDVPYAEWSQAFRPHNLAFFILPLDYAFAFKWWIMGYLLVLSCYFFVLALLPGKRLIAASIGLALLFAGMSQWWYQYATLGSMYYALFGATIAIHLVRAKRLAHSALWGGLLAYVMVCFALVLYPPFQIACGLASGIFVAGYFLQNLRKAPLPWHKLGILAGSILLAGVVVLLFVCTREGVISTITNTVYPGKRVIASGGLDAAHVFSGNLAPIFQSTSHANHYVIAHGEPLNQSEASNFILLIPFLFLPALCLIYRDYRQHKPADWPLITILLGVMLCMAWLFVPHLDLLGRFLFLDKVQGLRLLLGLGLLNTMLIVLIIRRSEDMKQLLKRKHALIVLYAIGVLAVEYLLGKYAMQRSFGFITMPYVIALALPVPVIVYLLLTNRTTLAVIGFLGFSVIGTMLVNPVYRGTETLTKTPLSQAVQELARSGKGNWASEVSFVENIPAMNGAHTISGVYSYPQLDIWRSSGSQPDLYNRYAHVTFAFDRDTSIAVKTQLSLIGNDHFEVITEPCGQYVHNLGIRFILTSHEIDDSCLQLEKTIHYPIQDFRIYRIR